MRKDKSVKIPAPRKLSSGSWFIQLRLDGQSVSITAPSEAECKRRAQLLKAEHLSGKKVRTVPNSTIGELIDDYIDARRNILSSSTILFYERTRKNRFQTIMHRRVGDVGNWQVVLNQEARMVSPKTLKGAWGVVSAALHAAGCDVPNVSLPSVQTAPHEYLLPEQVLALIDAVRDLPCEIGVLLGLHGLRNSEIYGLTWQNVDLAAGSLTVDGAVVAGPDGFIAKRTNKNRTSKRTIPIMIPRLAEALSATPANDRTGTVMTTYPSVLYKQLARVCERNDLPRIGVHGLRHSFASLAYHLQVPERIAMQIGGWSDPATMHKIYTHIAQQDVNSYGAELKAFFEKR